MIGFNEFGVYLRKKNGWGNAGMGQNVAGDHGFLVHVW